MRESLDLEQKATEIASMCQVLRNSLNHLIFTENKLRSFRDYQQLQIANLGIVNNSKMTFFKQSKNKPFKPKRQSHLRPARTSVSTPDKPTMQVEAELVKQLENEQNFENLRGSKQQILDNMQRENEQKLKKGDIVPTNHSKQGISELMKKEDYVGEEQLIGKMGDRDVIRQNETEETSNNLGIDDVKLEESYESQTASNENNQEQQKEDCPEKSETKQLGKQQQSNQIDKDNNNLTKWSPNAFSPERKRISTGECVPFSQEFKLERQKSEFQYGMSEKKKILGKQFSSFSKCVNRNSYGNSSNSNSSNWIQRDHSNQHNCSNVSKSRRFDFYQSPLYQKIEHNFLESYNQPHRGLRGECQCLHCNNHVLIPQPFSPAIPLKRFNQPIINVPLSNMYGKVKNSQFESASPTPNQSIPQMKQPQINQEIKQEDISQSISGKVENVESKVAAPSPCPREQESSQISIPPQSNQLLNQTTEKSLQIPGSIPRKGKKFPSVIFIEGSKKFQCQICAKTFDSKQKLGGHKARSHPDAPCQRTEREKKRKYIDSLEETDVIINQEENEKHKKINGSLIDNKVLQQKINPQVSQGTDNNRQVILDIQQNGLNNAENKRNTLKEFFNFDDIIVNCEPENIKDPSHFPQLLKKAIQKLKISQQSKQNRQKQAHNGGVI